MEQPRHVARRRPGPDPGILPEPPRRPTDDKLWNRSAAPSDWSQRLSLGSGGGAVAPDSQSARGATGNAGFGAAVALGPPCSAAVRMRRGASPVSSRRAGDAEGRPWPWRGRGWRRWRVPSVAGPGSPSRQRLGAAVCCWAVSHSPFSSCPAGLVRELLREEAPSRIAALTEELFQAAGSVCEEDGSAAEVPLASPPGEMGVPCAPQRAAALAQVGGCGPAALPARPAASRPCPRANRSVNKAAYSFGF